MSFLKLPQSDPIKVGKEKATNAGDDIKILFEGLQISEATRKSTRLFLKN